MRATSLRDIMLADSLKHIKSEVLLISPENDVAVLAVLAQIGYDVKQPFEYVPSKHRDLRNKIGIGFQVVGEYSRDPKFKSFLDTTDRVILAGMLDPSMGRELSTMQGRKNTYKGDDKWDDGSRAKASDPRYFSDQELLDLGWTKGDDEDGEYASAEYIEETWEQDLRAIKQLQDVLDIVRGK